MYNRYIPSTQGIYEKQVIGEAAESCASAETTTQIKHQSQLAEGAEQKSAGTFPLHDRNKDLGDFLLLCIVLLLCLDAEEDSLPMIIMAAILLM